MLLRRYLRLHADALFVSPPQFFTGCLQRLPGLPKFCGVTSRKLSRRNELLISGFSKHLLE